MSEHEGSDRSDRLAFAMQLLRDGALSRARLPQSSRRHEQVLDDMLGRLSFQQIPDGKEAGRRPLAALTARDSNDASIALLDAWAAVCDVLGFYNDRVAEEGYLDTARQSRSVRHLVRPLGMQPSPGAAATVDLAFTVEAAPDESGVSRIPAGTQVQSIPGQNELPQTFETGAEFVARSDWNELRLDCRPRPVDQDFVYDAAAAQRCTTRLWLSGRSGKVKPGDLLLIAEAPPETPREPRRETAENWATVVVRSVRYFAAEVATLLEWEPSDVSAARSVLRIEQPQVHRFGREFGVFGKTATDWRNLPDDVKTAHHATWHALEYNAAKNPTERNALACRGLPPADLRALAVDNAGFLYVATARGVFRSQSEFDLESARQIGVDWIDISGSLPNKDVHCCIATPNGLFVGTTQGGLFRQVRPGEWETLGPLMIVDPTTKQAIVATVRMLELAPPTFLVARSAAKLFRLRFDEPGQAYSVADAPLTPSVALPSSPLFPTTLQLRNSESVTFVGRRFQRFNEDEWPGFRLGDVLPLSGAVSNLAPGDWMLAVEEPPVATEARGGDAVPSPRSRFQPFRVARTRLESRHEFGITGEVTLVEPEASSRESRDEARFAPLNRRRTRVLANSERLELAERTEPRASSLSGNLLKLESSAHGLVAGQRLLIRGRAISSDESGLSRESHSRDVSEVGVIASIVDGNPEIQLRDALQNAYDPATVRINANVVSATQGERIEQEVLGSGDAGAIFQRFRLRRPPLTYVLDEATGALVSTLRIEVGGVRWRETPTLIGQAADARCYVLMQDDQGDTYVLFGDGRTGARLPTGVENVTATYRSGLGTAGNVRAGQLTSLLSPPHKVEAVVNPRAADGGVNPDRGEDLRRSGPEYVARCRGLICLADYQRIASEFPGISHARADRQPDDSIVVIVGAVGLDSGDPVRAEVLTRRTKSLENRLRALNPLQSVRVATCVKRPFRIVAELFVDEERNGSDVEAAARRALYETFGESQCVFDGRVFASEIIDLLQRVPGVSGVRLSEPSDCVAMSRDELLFLDDATDACRLLLRPARREVRP